MSINWNTSSAAAAPNLGAAALLNNNTGSTYDLQRAAAEQIQGMGQTAQRDLAVAQTDQRETGRGNFNAFGERMNELGIDLGWFPENSFNQLSHFGQGNKWGDQFGGQSWDQALASGDTNQIRGMLDAAHSGRKQSTKALGGFSPFHAGLLAVGAGLAGTGGLGFFNGGAASATGSAGTGVTQAFATPAFSSGLSTGATGLGVAGSNIGALSSTGLMGTLGGYAPAVAGTSLGSNVIGNNSWLSHLSKLKDLPSGNLPGKQDQPPQLQNFQSSSSGSFSPISQASPTFNSASNFQNNIQNTLSYANPNLSGTSKPFQTVQELFNKRYS